MDTGNLIARQLRYCRAGAESPEQIAQVEWWQAKVAELRKQQPSAEPVPADQAQELQATGTGGGR
jgi:hypothetical protein